LSPIVKCFLGVAEFEKRLTILVLELHSTSKINPDLKVRFGFTRWFHSFV